MKMRLKKGDDVLVLAGKDRGKRGKILKVLPRERRVIVEGVNLRKKHQRARRQGQKGQIVEMAHPLDRSNLQLFCSHCKRGVRLGYRVSAKSKERICRRCGRVI